MMARLGLYETEASLDAVEPCIDVIYTAGRAGLLGFEKAQLLLHLDHGSLRIREISPHCAQEIEDEIAAFL
jgi:hypothetical protein